MIKNKIDTHSLTGFVAYANMYYIIYDFTKNVVKLLTVIGLLVHMHYKTCRINIIAVDALVFVDRIICLCVMMD